MKKKGIPQEGLKLLACVTMLIDHVAAVMVSQYDTYVFLRGMGRIAFPIFCFLLVEGASYTRNPKKYALRLAIGALLAELPFDYALFGGFTWAYQSVMLTLLLGFGALMAMKRCGKVYWKIAVMIPFVLAGELLKVDYGYHGVLLICLLGLVRDMPNGKWMQLAVIPFMCSIIPSFGILVFGIRIPLECIGALSIIPIGLYRGCKLSRSRILQWAFYLFYPVHLGIIWLISGLS